MYIDLVVGSYEIGGKKELFHAPAFSKLKEGDLVMVGDKRVIVKAVCTAETGSDTEKCLSLAVGTPLPLERITGIFKYAECDYKQG